MERAKQPVLGVIVCTLTLVLTPAALSRIIYVDDDAPPAGNGSSWTSAYQFLQDAVAAATDSDKPVEIRVAQGTYRPDEGKTQARGDSEATFRLLSGVTIKGGYAGLGRPDPNAWDPVSYETNLNGDLQGNDDFSWLATLTDNSSHVVTAIGVDATAVLEGLTISHGVYHGVMDRGGNPGPPQGGGGLYNESGSPLIRQCVFSQNRVYLGYGSGVFNYAGSAARFEGCTFDRGSSLHDYQSRSTIRDCRFIKNGAIGLIESTSEVSDCLFAENEGTAVALGAKSRVTILNSAFTANKMAIVGNDGSQVECKGCTFEGNGGDVSGGAAHVDRGSFTDCVFRANSATANGAIWANYLDLNRCVLVQNSAQIDGTVSCSHGQIRQCLFEGNQATRGVGALSINKGGALTNCTFVGNRSVSFGIINLRVQEPLVLTNCIVRDNICVDTRYPLIVVRGSFKTAIRYSNVSDSPDLWRSVRDAVGNIDVDPLFAAPGHWDPNGTLDDPNDDFWVSGDYHLKSQAGRWDPNNRSWVKDNVTSPCIDVGDPNSPVGDEPFPNGGRINMGAYGGTAEASKSYFGEPVCETIIAGDINGDCRVDFADLVIITSHWLWDADALPTRPSPDQSKK